MPAIAGFHPWFASTLSDGSRASFEFDPGIRYLCDESGIPIGTVPGGGLRPWDDSFAQVAGTPRIDWENGLSVAIESEATHWIVCETMPGAFCIEPLSGPVNGLRTGDYTIVRPGEPLTHRMTLRWRNL